MTAMVRLPFIYKKKDLSVFFLELVKGIEPPTPSLRMKCSTIEPHQHFLQQIYYITFL